MQASKTHMDNYNDGNLDNDDETLINRSSNNVGSSNDNKINHI